MLRCFQPSTSLFTADSGDVTMSYLLWYVVQQPVCHCYCLCFEINIYHATYVMSHTRHLLNWFFPMPRCTGSTLSLFWMSKLLTLDYSFHLCKCARVYFGLREHEGACQFLFNHADSSSENIDYQLLTCPRWWISSELQISITGMTIWFLGITSCLCLCPQQIIIEA